MKKIVVILLVGLCKASVTAGNFKPTVIAFGACAHENKPQPIWDAIVNAKPDLFIFAGDNIYADTEDMEVMTGNMLKLLRS